MQIKMTVKEIQDKLCFLWDEDREKYILPLFKQQMCPCSWGTMMEFQDSWNYALDYKDFVLAQNKEIERCIALEKTDLGIKARALFNLKPLTDESEVLIDEEAS